MSEYVGGKNISNITYPKFEEYIEETKCISNGKTISIDFPAYGGEVWEFLNNMKTVSTAFNKIPGNYDVFLKNVKNIFEEYGYGMSPDKNCVVCFSENKFVKKFKDAYHLYMRNGKNKERKELLKKFWKKSFMPYVRRLSENALCSNDRIKNKNPDEGGRSIDKEAYTEIYLGGNVWKDTEGGIFKGNKNMETLTLGKGVETVTKQTFDNCKKLKYVYIEAENLTIEGEAFNGCKALERVKICKGVKKLNIKPQAFLNCSNLSDIVISSNSKGIEIEIAKDAFDGCNNLKKENIKGNGEVVDAIKNVLLEN